ncbi:capsular polysaccharide biosynthesis protein [Ruixingdingia sedimenti]|uniref:Capsular polysaccharide biosynthesis protein n=1 Tax=Ruixingdingia sedimenti TaxID=3073604 RepID=A0ABU1FCI0_9RHOB|nr:capsular polysaccharide biosynthesis protein [Xinfangfangia sp. LG-4]MDR5654600.1 capsular polysaccharide biosynthesis protein [Xinfangfangia sp. LG-4]
MRGADAAAGLEAAGDAPRRLFVRAGGLARPGRVRRILTLAGLRPVVLGRPGPDDLVGVWGRSPIAARGERLAAATGAGLVRIEDAFLRSIRPGRAGEGPLGLLIDRTGGVHFDAAAPSALEVLLARHPLDDTALLDRAREGMARLAAGSLSKYNAHDPALPAPPPGYVLVVDQTAGDAAITHGGATWATFREMLFRAQDDHPGARIVIRTHPETAMGLRAGHFGPEDARGNITLLSDPVAPQALLEGAIAVYTVSSQLGFEAILAGHRPVVLGRPFYAGWGLSRDEAGPLPRRSRRLTRAQIFAAAMILAPTWYDPCRDRLCSFEEALDQLEAQVRAYREDRTGHVATGMRLWKRGHLQRFFGTEKPLRFADPPARALAQAGAEGRGLLVWAGKAPEGLAAPGVTVRRVEDGFLRSRGLGADLVPPLSLVTDDLGIYYDPAGESRLERLIAAPCPAGGERRAERLVAALAARGVTKYNLGGGPVPDLPPGRRILVPGQVEDDASIRLGAGEVATNLALLERVRAENAQAVILWKPHPDVAAGLRPGAVAAADAARLADVTLAGIDAAAALAVADEVWTITSTLGFEALLRGLPVTCLGTPFYAGWGLTRDLCPLPARRQARPGLHALAHAALIAYPRYRDPVTGLPCPPEVAVERLASGAVARGGPVLRVLAKAQGALASFAPLWR